MGTTSNTSKMTWTITIVREQKSIYALNPSGRKIWESKPKTETDAFVGFKIVDDRIICKTWNGFETTYSIYNGKILDHKFTK